MCVLCIFFQGLLVYVNYGTINDFLYLTENLSLSLNGRICIARYGHIYRGDKVCRFLFSWDHSLVQEACQVKICYESLQERMMAHSWSPWYKADTNHVCLSSIPVEFHPDCVPFFIHHSPGQAGSVLWLQWSDHIFWPSWVCSKGWFPCLSQWSQPPAGWGAEGVTADL